jgi:tRNA (guanine-N7-)-methyltransferase
MKKESNNVWSTQNGPNENLLKTLSRYDKKVYKRPIADFSRRTFETILEAINKFGNNSIILDICCGTGESTYNLATLYPSHLIIGIDKSMSRLERNNSFKAVRPQNILLIRGEVLDLSYLFYQAVKQKQVVVFKQFILYPNPWPKEKHFKRRFSGNPITPFIFGLNCSIEIRSNWKIYLEEFCLAAKFYGYGSMTLDSFTPEKTSTAVEKKFLDRGHFLYKCVVEFD